MLNTVSSLNILDTEQARYRALTATYATAPLPHLDALVDDQPFEVPHLDADAHHRAACNDLVARFDVLFSNASLATAAVAGIIGLGAAVRVVTLYVGGVL